MKKDISEKLCDVLADMNNMMVGLSHEELKKSILFQSPVKKFHKRRLKIKKKIADIINNLNDKKDYITYEDIPRKITKEELFNQLDL